MNIVKKLIHTILFPAAFFYVLITLGMTAVVKFGKLEQSILGFSGLLIILLFCICLSSANLLFKIKQISLPFRFALHYLAVVLSLYVVFGLFAGRRISVLLSIALAAVYILAALVTTVIQKKKQQKASGDEPYKKVFH